MLTRFLTTTTNKHSKEAVLAETFDQKGSPMTARQALATTTPKSPSSRVFSLSLTRSPLFAARALRAEMFLL